MKLIRQALEVIAFVAGATWSLLFRKPRNGEEVGPHPDGTQTTGAESIAGGVAAIRHYRLVECIANWTDAELAHVDAAQIRHIARVVMGGADPTYPPFPPEDGNDSGKSGRTAQSQAETSDHTTGASEALCGRPDAGLAAWAEQRGERCHDDWAGAWLPADFEAWARHIAEADSPTPAEQRKRFQEIAGKPRPSAGEIKQVLEDLQAAGRWADDMVTDHSEPDYHVITIAAAEGVIDTLAVHLLAMELERDELAATLRKVAEQAKPIDDTDLAELVQRARIIAERMERDGAYRVPSPSAREVIVALIGAVNDQARKLAADDDAKAIHICGCEAPSPGDSASDAYTAITAWVRSATDIGTREWIKLCSRLRWDLLEARKVAGAVETLRAANTNLVAQREEWRKGRTYTDDQRKAAMEALRERTDRMAWPAGETRNLHQSMAVDAIAKALGLERGK